MKCERCGSGQGISLPGMECPVCDAESGRSGGRGEPGRTEVTDHAGRVVDLRDLVDLGEPGEFGRADQSWIPLPPGTSSGRPRGGAAPGGAVSGSTVSGSTAPGAVQATCPRSRKRLAVTVTVLALACVAATIGAVVRSTGNDVGEGSADVPTDIGSPELPGPGDAVTSSPSAGGDATGGAAPRPPAASSPSSSVSSSPSSSPDPGAGIWAGPGCSTGKYREKGRFENGRAAWYTVESGGFKGGSCDGSFSAVPMSGSPNVDGGSSAVWSWKLGKGYEKCALSVYIPDSGRDADVAGAPTVYGVLSDPSDITSTYAAIGIRQTVHRGTLVAAGSYPVKGTSFSVRLVDRGQDWGSKERFGAHHAAAQMKVDCE